MRRRRAAEPSAMNQLSFDLKFKEVNSGLETDNRSKRRWADQNLKKYKEYKASGIWGWIEDVHWWMHQAETFARWSHQVKGPDK